MEGGRVMVLRALLALVLLAPSVGRAEIISIRGVEIELPPPPGFVRITKEMEPAYSTTKQFVAPENVEFASYVEYNQAELARLGHMPDLTRRFTAQAEKKLLRKSYSRERFAKWKEGFKAFIEETNAPEKFEKQAVTNAEGLRVVPVRAYPPHEDSQNILAFSLEFRITGDGMPAGGLPVVSTTAAVHVGGKILLLYGYGGFNDLEWTRHMVGSWSRWVLTRNPELASSHPSSSGFDFGRSLIVGLMCAAFAGAMQFFSRFYKPKGEKQEPPPSS